VLYTNKCCAREAGMSSFKKDVETTGDFDLQLDSCLRRNDILRHRENVGTAGVPTYELTARQLS